VAASASTFALPPSTLTIVEKELQATVVVEEMVRQPAGSAENVEKLAMLPMGAVVE
jgi:hypothetical protein